MYRVTANCAATYLQRRTRHRHDELPDAAELVDLRTDVDPELRADAGDLRGRLLVALETLPPKLRAVVVLRDVYEMSHEAIASELGISGTAAKVRLHRARHKLRSELFPELDGRDRLARVLRGLVYGFFIEYLPLPYDDRMRFLAQRADEISEVIFPS